MPRAGNINTREANVSVVPVNTCNEEGKSTCCGSSSADKNGEGREASLPAYPALMLEATTLLLPEPTQGALADHHLTMANHLTMARGVVAVVAPSWFSVVMIHRQVRTAVDGRTK